MKIGAATTDLIVNRTCIKNLNENERILYIHSYLATNKDTLPWFVQAKLHTRAARARY